MAVFSDTYKVRISKLSSVKGQAVNIFSVVGWAPAGLCHCSAPPL